MSTIVGRAAWTTRLREDVERTVTSHGGTILIGGEAGIGKTTLVGSVVEHARSRGAIAAVGTCSDSAAAPALWPWTQIHRGLRRSVPAGHFQAAVSEAGLEVTDLVRAADPIDGDPEFGLFDAITTLLSAVSADHPLVLVIEDLHWADPASVDLLDHVSRHAWFERILMIATYRDTEVGAADHPLHHSVTALTPSSGTIQLSGLDPAAVTSLVNQVTGRTPSAEALDALHHRSGGNPFFVEQTARLWAAGQDERVLAPGVAEAVRRRVAPLPDDARLLLRAAAILGGTPSLALLASVAELEPPTASRALAAALTARLLRATGEGAYAFVHDLVRETVLDDLLPDDAARLHAAAVSALTDDPAPGSARRSAEHAVSAGDLIPAERVVDLLLAAGREADAQLDLAGAISAYRRAADTTADPDRRLLLTLELATTVYYEAVTHRGSTDEAIALISAVIDDADQATPATAARIALSTRRHRELSPNRTTSLLRSAGAALLPAPLPESDEDLAGALTDHLTAVARAESDHAALTTMLTVQHESLWRAGTAGERERIMTELLTTARRSGDRDTEQFANSMLWVTMLEQGNPAYLEQYRTFATLAARYQTARYAASEKLDGALIAAFRGRFDEAWRLWDAGREGLDPATPFGQMAEYLAWTLDRQQGDLPAARARLERLGSSGIDRHLLLAAQAAAERRFDEASAALARVSEEAEILPILRDRLIATVAAGTGDPALLDQARRTLEPVRGTWSVDLYGMDLGGPVDLYLGEVEAAAGRHERAVALLDSAVDAAEHLTSPYWAATARIALLTALGPQHDRAAGVRDLLAAALDVLDVPLLNRHAQAVLAPGGGEAPEPVPQRSAAAPTGPPASRGEFRRTGPVWQVGIGDQTVAVPDTKGLADLHVLLRSPNTDVPSTDLLHPDPEAKAAARQGGDPVLDVEARARYRQHLEILDAQLDDAGLSGATDRRDALLAEREALLTELRTATGLGGRPRRLGDEAERARKAVTARIRDTLRKLDALHPALAEHLRASVSTGASCRYTPNPGDDVTWRLH